MTEAVSEQEPHVTLGSFLKKQFIDVIDWTEPEVPPRPELPEGDGDAVVTH